MIAGDDLFALLAWGAEGVRIDLFDQNDRRRAEWIMSWHDVLAMVPSGYNHPVARAGPLGVDFLALDRQGALLVVHWSWEDLTNRAKLSASPVKDESA